VLGSTPPAERIRRRGHGAALPVSGQVAVALLASGPTSVVHILLGRSFRCAPDGPR